MASVSALGAFGIIVNPSSKNMLTWSPDLDGKQNPIILCLGAHCDDIEIGCGGLLSQLAKRYANAEFRNVIFSATPTREKETRHALGQILADATNVQVDVLGYRNSYFPYHGAEIKEYFEQLRRDCNPDLILTHYRDDLHQDHRLISELTWNMYRDHAILEYEIPKYDGDLGQPSVYVPLSNLAADEKIRCLVECFPSQAARRWFTEGTFRSLLRLRGIECNAESGYAEGYHSRKLSVLI